MAGEGKRHHMMLEEVEPIEITEIAATTPGGIFARIKATGKLAWLPRSQTQIQPYLAIVPAWLARKLLHGCAD